MFGSSFEHLKQILHILFQSSSVSTILHILGFSSIFLFFFLTLRSCVVETSCCSFGGRSLLLIVLNFEVNWLNFSEFLRTFVSFHGN